jgi:hypothetical protein
VEPKGDKVQRAMGAIPFIDAGNVYVPEEGLTVWEPEFIEECRTFPLGVNDDQVDAMTQALDELYYNEAPEPAVPQKSHIKKDVVLKEAPVSLGGRRARKKQAREAFNQWCSREGLY